MIRAIVSGAASAAGAEVIRIIINHPDVEIVAALEPALAGEAVSAHIPGLVGETNLVFADSAGAAKADVVFICDSTPLPFDIDAPENDHLRIIDLSGATYDSELWVQGIPELNRKALVRGAKRAYIPRPHTILAATALLPVAKNLMLTSTVMPVFNDFNADESPAEMAELRKALLSLQKSFNSALTAGPKATHAYNSVLTEAAVVRPDKRFGEAVVMTMVSLDARHLKQMYEEYFDDHNFVHLIDRDAVAADVVNTNKCLLHVSTDGRTMRIHAAFDPRIHGEAGTAVHCMNLLFGLHELIGLQLKALA